MECHNDDRGPGWPGEKCTFTYTRFLTTDRSRGDIDDNSLESIIVIIIIIIVVVVVVGATNPQRAGAQAREGTNSKRKKKRGIKLMLVFFFAGFLCFHSPFDGYDDGDKKQDLG